MYQSVGQDGVHIIGEAMQLPLYRHTIGGLPIDQTSDYACPSNRDETEDLTTLLQTVLVRFCAPFSLR